jgi:predicted NBD/HSP70 family sugar kinase
MGCVTIGVSQLKFDFDREASVLDARTLLSDSEGIRKENRVKVIKALMCRPAIRRDLVKATGLSAATVSTAVRELLDEEIAGEGVTRDGREVWLRETHGVAVGVSLGMRTATVAARRVHQPHSGVRVEHVDRGISGGDEWVDRTAETIHALAGALGRHRWDFATVGMAVPWSVHPRTQLPGEPSPAWADGRDVGRLLAARLAPDGSPELAGGPLKVVVDTDARLAAMYMRTYVHRYETMFYIQVSAHVSGGMLVGNTDVRGAHGTVANVGHVSVDFAGRDCWCGLRGCLETYVNAGALLEDAYVRCHSQQSLPPSTIEQLVSRAKSHDHVCSEVLRRAAVQLARALVPVRVLTDPHAIVIGGTVAPGFDLVQAWCRRELERSRWGREVPLLISDHEAAAHGALLLGLTGHFN